MLLLRKFVNSQWKLMKIFFSISSFFSSDEKKSNNVLFLLIHQAKQKNTQTPQKRWIKKLGLLSPFDTFPEIYLSRYRCSNVSQRNKKRSGYSLNWSFAALIAVMTTHILLSHCSWKADPTCVGVRISMLPRVTPNFLPIMSSGNTSLLVKYVII